MSEPAFTCLHCYERVSEPMAHYEVGKGWSCSENYPRHTGANAHVCCEHDPNKACCDNHPACTDAAERHCDGPNCPFGCGDAERNARFVEKARERMATGLTVGLLVGLERDHFEVYARGPSEPKDGKPVEPVKE